MTYKPHFDRFPTHNDKGEVFSVDGKPMSTDPMLGEDRGVKKLLYRTLDRLLKALNSIFPTHFS